MLMKCMMKIPRGFEKIKKQGGEKQRQGCNSSQIFKQYEAKHHRKPLKKITKLEM